MTTPVGNPRSRTGSALIWAGLATVVVGLILAAVSLFRTIGAVGLGDTIGSPVIEAPVTVVDYYEPETYFLYQADDGTARVTPSEVTVRGADGELAVSTPGYQATIDDGDVTMAAVAAFTVTQAGEYTVTVAPDEPTLVRVAPALGAGVGSALAWSSGIAAGALLSLVGLVLLVVGLVRRSADGTSPGQPAAGLPAAGQAAVAQAVTAAAATTPVAAPRQVLPPPGWYPDPTDPRAQRYWDGQSWTEHHT